MKYAAVFLTLIFVAAAALAGYLWLTCDVTVTAQGISATEAAARPELFETLRAAHPEEVTGDIGGYVFYTWHVLVNNTTFVDVEQVECRLSLLPGDVCQVPDLMNRVVPARSTRVVEVTALTRMNASPVRDATVSWYLWGKPAFAPLLLH